jgi:hypothetical protein
MSLSTTYLALSGKQYQCFRQEQAQHTNMGDRASRSPISLELPKSNQSLKLKNSATGFPVTIAKNYLARGGCQCEHLWGNFLSVTDAATNFWAFFMLVGGWLAVDL